MTKPRAIVSASLAERGRPEQWANEQESAARCGMTADVFAKKLPDMMAAGFPPKCAWNDKRFIPAIDEWCRLHHMDTVLQDQNPADAERERENWNA